MDQSSIKILLVDDEEDILEFMEYNLVKEGYTIFTTDNGKDAIDIAIEKKPHLIILDVMMPGQDGMETCSILRSMPQFTSTLIVFLTARNEDYSEIAGFDAGADDYIAKPIKPRVLISRLKALLRRMKDDTYKKRTQLGDLVIDPEQYQVFKNDQPVKLPRKAFELLLLLSSKPGRVFRRDEILQSVWGGDVIVGDRTIDVHIRKLRKKIGENHIRTVKGVGYHFEQ